MTNISMGLRTIVVALVAGTISSSSFAFTVQVPNLGGVGDDANAFPLSSVFGPMRYQQIYAASAFPQGGIIDEIRFRNDELFGIPYGPTPLNLQVSLAYAATTVQSASPTFANNIGDNSTVVLDGIVTLSYSGVHSLTFDAVLDVSNTFFYDPSHGDLLVQILARDYHAFTFFDASSAAQQQTTTRIWSYGGGVDATDGQVGIGPFGNTAPIGLVTEFKFVPEPNSVCLMLVGTLLGLLASRRISLTWRRS